jgi:hypothetical protein
MIDNGATARRFFGTIGGFKENGTNNDVAGYLGFYTGNGVFGLMAERMRITHAGRVGIGSTNPGGQFELSLNEARSLEKFGRRR